MAVVWSNTFDGPNGDPVTVANSANYGDALSNWWETVTYQASWAAEGPASIQLGGPGVGEWSGVEVTGVGGTEVALRMYLNLQDDIDIALRPDSGDSVALTLRSDGSLDYPGGSDPAGTIPTILRLEVIADGGGWALRVFDDITSNDYLLSRNGAHSATGPWEWWVEDYSGDGVLIDEVALADDAEWIGPALPRREGTAMAVVIVGGAVAGEADQAEHSAFGAVAMAGAASGRKSTTGAAVPAQVVLTGVASGQPGPATPLPPAQGTPVRDMWIGPLGSMRRIRRGADTDRKPDLGSNEFVSLQGRVTTSRARWVPRRVSWSWDQLEPEDRDWLAEAAMVARTVDTTIEVIDPAARNLLTREQSRGRPLSGVVGDAALEELYALHGDGSLTVAVAGGQYYGAVTGAAQGASVVWLHPYHGDLGWPVLPGWPVYFGLQGLGAGSIYDIASLELAFHNRAGAMVGRGAAPAGAGLVSADVPDEAVTASPRAILTEASGLRVIGAASLTYAPPPATIALGDGCPTVAVTDYAEEPVLPWYSVDLDVVEVVASAVR